MTSGVVAAAPDASERPFGEMVAIWFIVTAGLGRW